MFYSFRFFIDRTPALKDIHCYLELLELLNRKLQLRFDSILYCILDPDSNERFIEKHLFPWNSEGKNQFSKISVNPIYTGRSGEMVAPIIIARDSCSYSQLFVNCRFFCRYPVYDLPMIIGIDFLNNNVGIIGINQFSEFFCSLSDLGFHINNSFVHLYSRIQEAVTLDGGRISTLVTTQEKKNIRNYINHRQNKCLNHIMDIYCINTLVESCIDKPTFNNLIKIVGVNNVMLVKDSVIFALPQLEQINLKYQQKNSAIILSLRSVLKMWL